MYRVQLTAVELEELKRRTHVVGIKSRVRDRLEMVRLAHSGWSIPRIAQHLQINEKSVRHWIKRYLAQGFEALADQPHVGPTSKLTPAVLGALEKEIGKRERTWTAEQISTWLIEEHQVTLSPKWIATCLRRRRHSYKRTQRHLRHMQDAEQVATRAADLETLEKGALRGC